MSYGRAPTKSVSAKPSSEQKFEYQVYQATLFWGVVIGNATSRGVGDERSDGDRLYHCATCQGSGVTPQGIPDVCDMPRGNLNALLKTPPH